MIENLAALGTLTAMEIVLGLDNVVFIAILVARLPLSAQARVRALGMSLALVLRLAFLAGASWLAGMTAPLFDAFGRGVSWRDLVLGAGGLFLIAKSTHEIHDKMGGDAEGGADSRPASAGSVIAQIIVLDLVFSIDSVITAVGMAQELWVMTAAMLIAVAVMIRLAGPVGRVVDRHPTLKVLALSFLILIGVMLLGEAGGFHLPKGYIYFAMAFSLGVELVNMRVRGSRDQAKGLAKG